MIFYIWKQWLNSWIQMTIWAKSHAFTPMEESEGRIDEEIEKGRVWRVRHLATFWAARSTEKREFKIGDYIRVVGRQGLVLFIEPLEEPHEQP